MISFFHVRLDQAQADLVPAAQAPFNIDEIWPIPPPPPPVPIDYNVPMVID